MAKHIMLDLETMGNDSDAAIVAIGAVAFEEDVGLQSAFYTAVKLESSVYHGLAISPSTVLWWLEQSKEARQALTSPEAMDLRDALGAFSRFVSENGGDKAQVWGNGAAFDNVIIRNAYKAVKLDVPWPFWNDRCYRTLRALNTSVKVPDRGGVHHNALDDAKYQAECAMLYLK